MRSLLSGMGGDPNQLLLIFAIASFETIPVVSKGLL